MSLKMICLYFSILGLAMSAGIFYAWTISVIPGLKLCPDKNYLETMQSINRAILNPGFFLVFFGTIFTMMASIYLQYKADVNQVFWLMVLSTVIYLIGTIAVTMFGNVPLNESLDVLNIAQMKSIAIEEFRAKYETNWNFYNAIRTLFSCLSFALLVLSVFLDKN